MFATIKFRIYPETEQGTTVWSFPFPYLDPAHVKVSATYQGRESLLPRTVTGQTVTITTPPVGALLTIFRDSNVLVPAVVFSDDEPIRIEDVETTTTQLLYLTQELADYIGFVPTQGHPP